MSEASEAYQRDIHRQITERLKDLVPSDPALPPHPYLRRHLAEHAALGHVLDDDHVTPTLLAWESSHQVRRLLTAGNETSDRQQWLQAWAALEPFALGAGPLSRLSSLQLARHAAATRTPLPDTALPNAPSFTSVPVTPLWSDRVAPTPAWTASPSEVTSLATVKASATGVPMVATGDDVGTLRLLRLDGRLAHIPLSIHSGAITHLLTMDGGLLITAGTDGRVMAVEEEDGQLTHRLITQREQTWVSSLTTYHPDGYPRLLVAAFSDGAVEAFDVGRFQPQSLHVKQLQDSSGLLCGIQTAEGGPRLLFSMHNTVYCYDGNSTVAHSHHSGRVRALLALSKGLYAVGDERGRVALCDLGAEDCVSVVRHDAVLAGGAPAPVTSLQLVSFDRQPSLVSAAGDGTLRLWRLPALQPVPGALTAHTAPVNAMTCLPGHASDRLLSGVPTGSYAAGPSTKPRSGKSPKPGIVSRPVPCPLRRRTGWLLRVRHGSSSETWQRAPRRRGLRAVASLPWRGPRLEGVGCWLRRWMTSASSVWTPPPTCGSARRWPVTFCRSERW